MIPLEHPAGSPHCETLRGAVDDAVALAVSALTPRELRDAAALAVTGGKRVRSLLCMLMCGAAGGREMDALPAATGIELLHASSLVHDDIMDESAVRRGRPTVQAQYGVPTAVLAGDALIALAFREIHRVGESVQRPVSGIFTEAFLHLCEGQGLDLHPGKAGATAPALHRSMVEKKTAKLIEASTTIGALLGSADPRLVRAAGVFGRNIGMAFQAHDDLLDVVGDERTMGKPPGLDRRNNRRTFLSLAYPASDGAADARDTLEGTRRLVAEYTDRACRPLEDLPATRSRELLRSMAVALAGRHA